MEDLKSEIIAEINIKLSAWKSVSERTLLKHMDDKFQKLQKSVNEKVEKQIHDQRQAFNKILEDTKTELESIRSNERKEIQAQRQALTSFLQELEKDVERIRSDAKKETQQQWSKKLEAKVKFIEDNLTKKASKELEKLQTERENQREIIDHRFQRHLKSVKTAKENYDEQSKKFKELHKDLKSESVKYREIMETMKTDFDQKFSEQANLNLFKRVNEVTSSQEKLKKDTFTFKSDLNLQIRKIIKHIDVIEGKPAKTEAEMLNWLAADLPVLPLNREVPSSPPASRCSDDESDKEKSVTPKRKSRNRSNSPERKRFRSSSSSGKKLQGKVTKVTKSVFFVESDNGQEYCGKVDICKNRYKYDARINDNISFYLFKNPNPTERHKLDYVDDPQLLKASTAKSTDSKNIVRLHGRVIEVMGKSFKILAYDERYYFASFHDRRQVDRKIFSQLKLDSEVWFQTDKSEHVQFPLTPYAFDLKLKNK